MASTLNADNGSVSGSAGLKSSADSSGVLALQTNGTTAVTISTGQVATFAQAPVLPAASIPQAALATGVAGNGPAFSAYINSNQSLSALTVTKVQFNTEEFDTNNNFNSTTNYRFTPTVAGYYQFNSIVYISGAPTTFEIIFYKNGAAYKQAFYMNNLTATATMVGGSLLTYMNGSTDYIEVYAQSQSATTIGGAAGSVFTQFSGAMVRSA